MEAVILKTIPYGDSDLILNLFSKNRGRIDLFGKGVRSSKKGRSGLCQPLNLCEFQIKEVKRGLPFLREVHVLNHHLYLREDLACLQSAQDFALALLNCQLPEKPAPKLFALLVSFLDQFKKPTNPRTLALSFRLKILLHDGLLPLDQRCSECSLQSDPLFFSLGHPFCLLHAPPQSLPFLQKEFECVRFLTENRSFAALKNFNLPKNLPQKILSLFNLLT